MGEGHPAAPRYHLGRVWTEVGFIKRETNQRMVTMAVLLQHVGISVVTGKGKSLKDQIKKLTDG